MAYPLAEFGGDRSVNPSPSLPKLELETLAYWEKDETFRASLAHRPAGENGSNEFVFYDGPPFANGLPHYGHLLTGYVKDVVGRYKTQRGFHVERRFGWDTHGLPAELEAERILGLHDKSQIDDMGIAEFNRVCRESVLRYTTQWQDYVTRQARWADFEHDYKTLDITFMESVIWAFKQLYDKGLAYEGYRVLPYCWRDETPLSNHELRMDDDVYQPRQDPAVTVGLRLDTGELVLIWTTTPWTLPSNLALAVGSDIDYVKVVPGESAALAGETVVLAASRVDAYRRELGEDAQVVTTFKGSELVGHRYVPPFPYFREQPNAHRILAADFVTTDDGTGIVHLAPAFGEDDKAVCDAMGIDPVVPVDEKGRFTSEVPEYEGVLVFDANKPIIADLKQGTGAIARMLLTEVPRLVRHETYEHSYPHCWRCRSPLIYKAVSSWFIAVTQVRDRLVELNEQITWVPEHIKEGSFGKWLSGARDWSVSRNRYWGTPIPVWQSDNPQYPRIDVYGSLDELERDFGVRPTDLHRPYVDELVRPNPDDPTGTSMMRRVPDILDVWFDSGSMPYAQVHYPFENRDWFEHHFPGDFIVEYIGQTRGWFYTLHVLAGALFDRPAFTSAISHGIVLGDDGRKMSKSLRNYPDVTEVFDRDGSDAMRWFLLASPILRGGNLIVTEQGIRDTVRQVLLPLWNTWYFFSLYANACRGGEGYHARAVTPEEVPGLDPLDRYLLARTRLLVTAVTQCLDVYDIAGACEAVREYIDLLTNWYVRRSRERFWEEDENAFNTLYTALEVLTRVAAPLAPLLSEQIWRGLTGGRSVHLTDYPTADESDPLNEVLVADHNLVAAMDRVRQACSTALGLRKSHGLRVRQPLRELTIVATATERSASATELRNFVDLIKDEVNVKSVVLLDDQDGAAQRFGIIQRMTVNARAAGPRLGRQVQSVIRAAKNGAWHMAHESDDSPVVVETDDGPVELLPGEFALETIADENLGDEHAVGLLSGGGFVVLGIGLDDELLSEGYVNDVVRAVQDERKAIGLHVSDRIELSLAVPRQWHAAVDARREHICAETLALSLAIEDAVTENIGVFVTKAVPA